MRTSVPSICHGGWLFVRGSPRRALKLMRIVKRPCSILSRKSCMMSRMMSASGFPCMEGDFPSPVHFWEEERKQAESDRRITGFLSCCLLASSNAKHAAPSSALLEELPSSPLPSWQQPPLCSSSLKKPTPMTPLSFDQQTTVTHFGENKRLHLESSKQNYYIISF